MKELLRVRTYSARWKSVRRGKLVEFLFKEDTEGFLWRIKA